MPPIDLTGVGGWFGAQNSLKDILAQTAARGAQERNQLESMMQLGLKDRAQLADEARVGVSEGDLALRQLQNQQLQPQLGANLRLTNANAYNAENKDVSDIASDSRRDQAARALLLLRGDIDENSAAKDRLFRGDQNDRDRIQRGVIAAGNDNTALKVAGMRQTDPADKPPTSVQTRAWGFFGQMRAGIEIMNELEDSLTKSDLALIHATPMSELLTHVALSPQGKRYVNAMRVYSEARLRDQSGAAIRPDEYDMDRLLIAKQIGDEAPEVAQKRYLRARATAGVAAKTGRMYESITGAPFEYERLIEELASPKQPGLGGGGQVIQDYDAATGQPVKKGGG
jgi:hypothetical protein